MPDTHRPKRRRRLRGPAAALAAGTALASGATLVAEPAAAADPEWHSPFGEQAWAFTSWRESNNVIIREGKTIRMQGWVASAAPGDGTLVFYQDELKAYVNNMGPASAYGGCLYLDYPTARHGNPFESHHHVANQGVAGIWSTTTAHAHFRTAQYKETGYTDPHLVQRQKIISVAPLVCGTQPTYIFNSVYK